MPRTFIAGIWLLAALVMASALPAQTPPDHLAAAQAAEARLDFRAALAELAAAIAAAPDASAPRLARAELHAKMRRPALALADLSAVLGAAPSNPAARLARADLYRDLGALSRAQEDYDTLLDADPANVAALIGRARVRTRSGLTGLARADYDAALALAPETPGLAKARAALDMPPGPPVSYDAALLMAPDFRIEEGAEDAPDRLVIVHAGNRLAEESRLFPRNALAEALDAGGLHVIHLFTYTGQDSAIWANLALICAGPEGFGAVFDRLATPQARDALDAIDSGAGREAFSVLLSAAYSQAGRDVAEAMSCAAERTRAFAYLAEWSAKRDLASSAGNGFYDTFPVLVLNNQVVAADVARAAISPADAMPEAVAEDPEVEAEAEAEAPPAQNSGEPQTPAPYTVAGLQPEYQPAPEASESDAPVTARVPPDLKGIWAPGLAACIAYTDRIAAPTRLDDALPSLNPLDGPAIGTVLLTSRRLYLFNAVGTECEVTQTQAANETGWQAMLTCRSALDPSRSTALTLDRRPNAGPAPRLSVRFGAGDSIVLLQCRVLGRLSADFASLWQRDAEGCRVSVPLDGAQATFTAERGALWLSLDAAPEGAAQGTLSVKIDGQPWPAPVSRSGPGQGIDLGDLGAATDRLALGLLLELRQSDAAGRTRETRTIPLLGSGQAMAALADCAQSQAQ